MQIRTNDPKLIRKLNSLAADFPELCRLTEVDEYSGTYFEVDKNRVSFHVTRPYSEYHPLFVEALQNTSYVEYILDEVFLNGSTEGKEAFVRANGDKIEELENRIQKLDFEKEKVSQPSIAI